MRGLRREIDRAPEYVQNAAVHVVAHMVAEFGVEGLRIAASQFRHFPDAQAIEVRRDGRPNSGNAQQIYGPGGLPYLSDHTDSSLPAGSVK